MRYDIKAIPTMYNGVRFRSRHEARWAAFFDRAGIEWDYEPFDLEGWFPDFKIWNSKLGKGELLVEVKPDDLRDSNDLIFKIIKAHEGHSLLVGESPVMENLEIRGQYNIGYLLNPVHHEGRTTFNIGYATLSHDGDISDYFGSYHHFSMKEETSEPENLMMIKAAWLACKNDVQYTHRGKK